MKKRLLKLCRAIASILAKDSNYAWYLYQKLTKVIDDVALINSDHRNAIATKIMQDVFQYDITGLKSYYDMIGQFQPITSGKVPTFDQDDECLPDNFERGFTYKRYDDRTSGNGPKYIYVISVDNDFNLINGIISTRQLMNPHDPNHTIVRLVNGIELKFEDYQKLPLDIQLDQTQTDTPTTIQFEPGVLYYRRDEVNDGPLFVYIRDIDNDRNIIDATVGHIPITSTPITLDNEIDIKFDNYRKVTMDDIIKYQSIIDPGDI